MKTCKCGKQLDSSAKLCPNCGKRHSSAAEGFLKKLIAAMIVGLAILCIIAMNQGSSSDVRSAAAAPAVVVLPAAPASPAQLEAAKRQLRKSWARQVDSTFLDAGIESTTKTSGPEDTVLIIHSALASRVFAHHLAEMSFPDAAEARGFKKLILTDDNDTQFTWDLTK